MDDDGALFKFRYLGVTVKLPEDCVMSPVELQLSKTPLSNVQLKLHPHERLISDVILFGPDGEIFYKPAELKIRHRVNNQELYPYTEIVVKQFEEVTDEWIDLDTKCSREIEG